VAQQDQQDLKEHKEIRVLLGRKAHKEPKAQQDQPAHKDPQDHLDQQDLKDRLALQDQQDLRAHRELQVPLDLKGHRGQLEHKVLLDLLLEVLTKLSTKTVPMLRLVAQTLHLMELH
jgi:hypothetical protein